MTAGQWLKDLKLRFAYRTFRSSRRGRPARTFADPGTQTLESRLLMTTFINAGGAAVGDFTTDSAYENGVARDYLRTRASIDLSHVDSSLPQEVFQSVAWDGRRGDELSFDIPVTGGSEYQVDLLFSEIWRGAFREGVRTFDVSLEGNTILSDFDIYREAGANTALVKSFTVTATDNNLDLDFVHGRNNPAIAGIIVRPLSETGQNSAPVISAIADQQTTVNSPIGPLNFTVTDADGDPITVTASSSNDAVIPDASVVVTGSGNSRAVTVTPATGATGTSTITVQASDGQATSSEQFSVTVNSPGQPQDPIGSGLMLNAGGGVVGDFTSATSFLNSVRTRSPRRPASVADVPASIPEAVFQSSVWTPARLGDVALNIPTLAGQSYQVDLLFAETLPRAFREGRRVFDVAIDGQQVLNDLDVFAEVGANTALVKTFSVIGDGNLDIDLSRVVSDPMISGVIVTPTGTIPEGPPVLQAIGTQSATVGNELQVNITATDPNDDVLTYSLVTTGLPGSPSIDPVLGIFRWTPPAAGTFNATVRASDGQLTDEATFSINVTNTGSVNLAPVLSPIGSRSVILGSALTFTASATDSNGDALTYAVSGTGLPGTPVINNTTGAFSWTPEAVGTFDVTVSVSDGELSDSETVSVTVTSANSQAPVLSPVSNQTVSAGSLLQFTVSATDADTPASSLQYFLSPDAPITASINAATGVVSWTPSAQDVGNVSFTVGVSDGDLIDSQLVTVIVTSSNLAPSFGPISNQTGVVGDLLELTLTASDPNGDTLTYSLVTTDLPGAASVHPSTGVFSWTPAEAGPGFDVTVRVTDSSGLSDTATFTVTVEDGGPGTGNGNNSSPVIAAVPVQNADVGIQLQFTVIATDPDGDPLEYFLDPTGPSGAVINGATGQITWTPTASDAGIHTFPVFVTDGVITVSRDVTINVADSGPGGNGNGDENTAPTFGPQDNYTVAAGSLLDVTITAFDSDPGEVLTYSLVTTGLPGDPQVVSGTGRFTWTPPASAAGSSFDVLLRVTDSGGLTDEALFTVSVQASSGNGNNNSNNTAPVMAAIPQQQATVGQELSFTVSATDADGDTLQYFFDPTAPATANLNSATGLFQWTPSAADVGTVTFPIFVTDNNGSADVFRNVVIVVSA
ncbi:MAG: putative Ig domain-containing protein [Planctomycetaceae bacterium]